MASATPPSDRNTYKLVAIVGGSCSGKTFLTRALSRQLGSNGVTLSQDDYYIDIRILSPDGTLPNFDHPDCIDVDRLARDLEALKRGETISPPSYDFTRHHRTGYQAPLPPRPVILIEGMFLLYFEKIRALLDESYYIACSPDLRLKRRLARDTRERGRTRESVLDVFDRQVEPGQQKFISPSRAFATKTITQEALIENFDEVCQQLISRWT